MHKKRNYREVDVAQRGDNSTAEAYNQRPVGHQHELCRSPHCNAASKGGILNVDLRKISSKTQWSIPQTTQMDKGQYHVQLPVLLEEAWDSHSGEHGWGQGQVGIDGRSVLAIAVVCDGWVEAGPEHPQKEGT